MAIQLKGGNAAPGETDKLMVLEHGFPGVGKTSLACSGPSPLYMYNFDRPATPIFKQLPDHYEINYAAEQMDVDGIAKQVAIGVLNRFDTFLRDAINDAKKAVAEGRDPGTFIADGFDLFWEYVKVAKLPGGDSESYAKEYADANTYMSTVLRRLGLSPMQVFLTSTSKYVWEGATKETKKVQPEGFKWRDRYITHELYLFSPEGLATPVEVPAGAPGQTHRAYFSKSKINESLAGSVVPNLSFSMLWRLVHGSPYPNNDKLWIPGKKPEPVTA